MTNYSNASKLLKFFHVDLCGNDDFSEFELSEMKEMIQTINDQYVDKFALNVVIDYFEKCDLYESKALVLFNTCLNTLNCSFNDLEYYEFFDYLNQFVDYIRGDHDSDFYIDNLPYGQVRLIDKDEIDQIWTDSLIEQIKECYDLPDLPNFVEIDWEQTAQNCKVDGLGHHFASYDHEEHDCGNYYIFRTN